MSLVAYASSEEDSEAEEAADEEVEAPNTPPHDSPVSQPPARGGLFATLPPPKASALPPPPPQGSGFPLLPPPPFLMGPPPGVRGFGPPPPAPSPAPGPPEPSAGSGEQPRPGGLLLPPPRNAASVASAPGPSPPASGPATLPSAGGDLGLPKPKKRTEPVKIVAPELHEGNSDSEEDEPAKKKNTLQVSIWYIELNKLHRKSACDRCWVSAIVNLFNTGLSGSSQGEGTGFNITSLGLRVCFPQDPSCFAVVTNCFSFCSQDYYSSGYYQEVEPAQAAPQEMSTDSSFLDDEAFKRLQGKRNRGREEINFVDIKGDDQLSGAQQWLTKSLTEEKTMKSFSKKKGDQPTGQQRRKHQITYLIHQAKERELELKNTWSENKLSRRQTQAKYGF
uniref:Proline rich mitotic checkpoint control factor n=1 Tax=Pavo cristatus TaxID=9049 RepID=A0A8C9L8N1_PAVCR